jgi:peptidyl-prolyl cis-trans isomerase D
VLEYKPATPRPFDEVRAETRRQLERKAASEMAQAAGKEKLALVEGGKDAGLAFGKTVAVTRNQAQPGFPPDALARIFQANPEKLPAYIGATGSGDYVIYKLIKVTDPPAPDAARLAAVNSRIAQQLGQEMFNAYLASLKSKADVKINQANLEKK